MKHGGLSHYLRPDGVYETSVLQPTANFNPVPDTQAIAASFVNPTGGGSLAGPQIQFLGRARRSRRGLRGSVNLLGAPTVRERWMAFWAGVRAKWQARRIMATTAALPPGDSGAVRTLDTSPRPQNSDPSALAVQSGWAPTMQTPASAAGYLPAAGDPPNRNAVRTAVAMDQAEAAFPVNFWQRTISQGFPPVVAARAANDIVSQWFDNKAGS